MHAHIHTYTVKKKKNKTKQQCIQIIGCNNDSQICGSVEAGQASGQVMSPRLARTLALGPFEIDGSKPDITVKRNRLISS